MIPPKTFSSHSKPCWKVKLGLLSLQIKKPKKFGSGFTTQKRANLSKLDKKDEMRLKGNLWLDKKLGDRNETKEDLKKI